MCASSLNKPSSTLVERLLSNAQLPVCPYDRRSPDYWTTPDDQPCVICGTLNDFSTPNLCRGADTRVMDEAAALILELQAELTFASVHAHDYARRALTAESALSRIQSETVEAWLEIKPLDWQETFVDRGDGSQEQAGWEADNGFDSWYSIEQYFASDSYGWQVTFDCDVIGDFDDPDRAKSRAQSHFEMCIASAIRSLKLPDYRGGDSEKTGAAG